MAGAYICHSLCLSALSVCSRMRQHPGGKSLHKSFPRARVRHLGVITCSCNISSLDCSGHLAWRKGLHSCSPCIACYNLEKMGNISKTWAEAEAGTGAGLESREGGGEAAERSYIVQSVKCRREKKACNFFLFFLSLKKEPVSISWLMSFAIVRACPQRVDDVGG